MSKFTRPLSLFLIALVIITGGGIWWFSRAPLASEFIAIIPDQAYIDWENDKLPTVDLNHDRIADTLLASSKSVQPILISLTYDEQAKTAVQRLEQILSGQETRLYPSASVMAATADLNTIKDIAKLPGVVLVEEDIEVAGLGRPVPTDLMIASSPVETTAVALIDGGTSYATAGRKVLVDSAGAGLDHGNLAAESLLKINPNTQLVDVAVLDKNATAPVSRLIEGVDWVIKEKDRLNISAINSSTGYRGPVSFAFNRALSAATAAGLAVVVPVSPELSAGEVAAKVPGLVRVGYYTPDQPAPDGYTKATVDVLTPVDSSELGSSAAAAGMSGVVSRLMAGEEEDWWNALSTTVFSIDEIIRLTPEQMDDVASGDPAALGEFMRSLSGQLQEAINQLKSNLGDSEDDRLLKQLLDTTSGLLSAFPYPTDSSGWNLEADVNLEDLLGNLIGNFDYGNQ